jgi:hypothetical protein
MWRNSYRIVTFALSSLLTLCAQTNVLTQHNDPERTGLNASETILTISNVNSSTFGKLFLATLDGKVDAQPLYLGGVSIANQGTHNILLAATENDSVYALDADSGAMLWHASTLLSGETPSDDRSCNQVTPTIGVTSTPVINTLNSPPLVYVVAMSKDASGQYHQRLHAFDMTTGSEQLGGPVEIQAQLPGTGEGSQGGQVIFDPTQYVARAGLLLSNGVVYIGWSSHCDHQPYTGWLMGYSASSLAQVSVLDVTPNGSEGALWNSGIGLAQDTSTGYLFLMDANGTFDTTLDAQGFPVNSDFGNGFLKVSTTNNTLSVTDYFNMFNTVSESDADEDLGSGGAVVLPDQTDNSGMVWHLVVGAGKDKNIYLANRDNMGKFNPSNNSGLYQELSGALAGMVYSGPAYFNGEVYFGAVSDSIKAFSLSDAMLSTSPVSQTSHKFAFPGATPSISANGTASGIVWVVENSREAVLHAFLASNLSTELYNSTQAPRRRDAFGAGNKFMTPTIVNGKVYVGTPTGVAAFGLLGQ